MERRIIFLFCFAVIAVVCGAQQFISLDSFLPEQLVHELQASGKLQSYAYKDKKYELRLVPQTELGIDASKLWIAKKRPVFVAELLNVIKKPVATEPGADVDMISEILRSFSTMKGIEYFSNSMQEFRVLYHEIYTVNNPKAKVRIIDQTGGSADGKVLYANQEMATFGSGFYKYAFKQNKTDVLMSSENLDPITYSIFKLVKPENFKFALYVSDLGDSVLVYSLVEADFFAIASLEERLKGAFSSRAEAVYTWFETSYLEKKLAVKND